jgi:hypothetical protein
LQIEQLCLDFIGGAESFSTGLCRAVVLSSEQRPENEAAVPRVSAIRLPSLI